MLRNSYISLLRSFLNQNVPTRDQADSNSSLAMFSSICLAALFISPFARVTVALPYIFTRAVDDFTPLVPRAVDVQRRLGPLLSKGASLYFPGSSQYENITDRWSVFARPTISVVVEPGNSQDVATTVWTFPFRVMAVL